MMLVMTWLTGEGKVLTPEATATQRLPNYNGGREKEQDKRDLAAGIS